MSIPIETVRTEGFSMRFFRFGTGDRPFVILPGLSVQSVMGAADAVAAAYADFAERYTVYLFDRREELPEQYSVYRMGLDTAAAMRALGLYDADIFGASQGGMIAQVIAIEAPELHDRHNPLADRPAPHPRTSSPRTSRCSISGSRSQGRETDPR